MAIIVFNGKTYNSLEEMPANEKQAYEQMMGMFVDKNGNGIPDLLEGDMVKNVLRAHSTKFDKNGQTYQSLNDLPPEARQGVERAFKMLSSMGLLPNVPAQFQSQKDQFENPPATVTSTPFVSREYDPVIEEDKGPNPLVWLLIGAVTALCIAAAVVVFMLR